TVEFASAAAGLDALLINEAVKRRLAGTCAWISGNLCRVRIQSVTRLSDPKMLHLDHDGLAVADRSGRDSQKFDSQGALQISGRGAGRLIRGDEIGDKGAADLNAVRGSIVGLRAGNEAQRG